ncbi:NAD-dependent epimerase/dehydratase family protein [Sphingobium chlorophenolicum]|uniref:NAD-dependent epimerase/dehydratase n=1 Tax=Sphingobium chlorophenolicum TaxID=46429 RepID=A0A081R7I6_SPHCR|nr:NAD-dependent epimerase/dehydratase family protein [Sphingobium chlorophenolicum]KEQ51159.1 NAD-dependent epimerase/dehydratase [Sphingobium chlorophenolicum]
MKIFLTGATGYTGSVVLDHLLRAGHQVTAIARTIPDRTGSGLDWVQGDFSEAEKISDLSAKADAVVHIGASHNDEMERLDKIVIDAVADALAGTGKVFVNTSATPIYGDTGMTPRDEHEPIENPHPLRAWRMRHDQQVVAMTERGFRTAILRPGYIYGRGAGILLSAINRARSSGVARFIGDGTGWSSTVHVDALSELYLLALANDKATGIYNAVSDEIVRNADIAQAIALKFGPGIIAESQPLEEARAVMGKLADLIVITCICSSQRARDDMGWLPNAPSVLSEIVGGSYSNV